MVLARGQQESKLFDNLSALDADFDGDFGIFDENDTYNFVPYKRPPFSLFLSARGA